MDTTTFAVTQRHQPKVRLLEIAAGTADLPCTKRNAVSWYHVYLKKEIKLAKRGQNGALYCLCTRGSVFRSFISGCLLHRRIQRECAIFIEFEHCVTWVQGQVVDIPRRLWTTRQRLHFVGVGYPVVTNLLCHCGVQLLITYILSVNEVIGNCPTHCSMSAISHVCPIAFCDFRSFVVHIFAGQNREMLLDNNKKRPISDDGGTKNRSGGFDLTPGIFRAHGACVRLVPQLAGKD